MCTITTTTSMKLITMVLATVISTGNGKSTETCWWLCPCCCIWVNKKPSKGIMINPLRALWARVSSMLQCCQCFGQARNNTGTVFLMTLRPKHDPHDESWRYFTHRKVDYGLWCIKHPLPLIISFPAKSLGYLHWSSLKILAWWSGELLDFLCIC